MTNPLIEEVLRIAGTQVGIREQPPGSNRGPAIDDYLRAAGLDQPPAGKGHPYCLAFVAWAFKGAAERLGLKVPVRIGPHVGRFVLRARALAPERLLTVPRRGAIFVWMKDPGRPETSPGHAGIVDVVAEGNPGYFISIEANTGAAGDVGSAEDRDGDGVRQKRRELTYPTGYIWLG